MRIWAVREANEDTWAPVPQRDGSSRAPDASLLERGRDYEIEAEGLASLSLVGDPSRAGDLAYLGHMLNDGATCTSEALRSMYLAESRARRNVEQVCLESCAMAMVATREIGQGEELLLSYGANYWISRLGRPGVSLAYSAPDEEDEDEDESPRRGPKAKQRRQGGSKPQKARRRASDRVR